MTEDDAKQKWCPMVRLVPVTFMGKLHAIFSNQPDDAFSGESCIGSDCMMWRESPEEPWSGYCGLGG